MCAQSREPLAWNLSSGELIDINSENELVTHWTRRIAYRAMQQMKERDGDIIGATKFLAFLNDPRDKEMVAAHRAATQPAARRNAASSDD